ncbi:RagB/SusD family nutrient uptake outer membrane protein [Chitinophaga agrisoli]|uniref:RagB/SusD family nutrient uptake outer membrane protein n=1 Tax=Chitinophaga agrisoli TaxID=2607653 RepID=A0A5B2W068_9BACT|nr:RagB/SusD family nutrient uptake outer membrane protein [Chitinophaga agrisoli]KAA2245443.1 RagB/SusD family nutrient uptake outer membrane protein [Chitinophaga agrisoli]
MYKKIFPLILITLLIQTSCTKDPDTVGRTDVYSSLNYPTTLPALFAVLTPAYANMRSAELHGFELMCKDFAGSEHVAELAYGGDISWTELVVNNMNTNNSYANNLWVGLYRGIKITNAFLDRADFYEQQYGSPAEATDLNRMRGEAHFLRALYYFYLECFYGEAYVGAAGAGGDKKGVPIITEMASSLDATQVPRNTAGEVWAFIISELQTAAEQLKGAQWSGNNTGRATEWSAKALLGKAYVFTQNWAAARTVLEDVISNSGKTLMPFSKYRNAFNGVDANEFNEESLFEINVDRNSMGGYGIFDFPATALTTSQGLIWSPCILGNDGTEGTGVGLGYCNEFFNDKNLARFGFKQPIYSLVNNPAFDNSKDPSYTNPKQVLDPAYRQQSLAARTNKTVDPRLYVSAMQPWLDSASNDGNIWRPVVKYIAIDNALKPNYYGWSLRKFVTYDNTIFNRQAAADAANYYLLRLADVYLLYAEANMNGGGNNAVALEYINKVKRRAYDYPVNAASPVDYATLTSATMAADPNLANNPLRYERWAELFGEGHWWFDVCRWRIGSGEAAYYATTLVGGAIKWSDAKSYTWPIPSNEMNTNTKMVQNPGY